MSDTPKSADECKKLLDNGWGIAMFRNDLGSYTAVAVTPRECNAFDSFIVDNDAHLTDDFEPSQALYRLTEKVLCDNIV